MFLKIDTVWAFIKILSIPDEEWFSETAVGYTATYFIKILLCSRWFCIPPHLRQCIVLFAVAEGWLLLDIGWFALLLYNDDDVDGADFLLIYIPGIITWPVSRFRVESSPRSINDPGVNSTLNYCLGRIKMGSLNHLHELWYKMFRVKIDWNCSLVGLLQHPFWL